MEIHFWLDAFQLLEPHLPRTGGHGGSARLKDHAVVRGAGGLSDRLSAVSDRISERLRATWPVCVRSLAGVVLKKGNGSWSGAARAAEEQAADGY
jgi:hypothetical protein